MGYMSREINSILTSVRTTELIFPDMLRLKDHCCVNLCTLLLSAQHQIDGAIGRGAVVRALVNQEEAPGKKHLSPRKTSNPHLRVWIWSPRCRLIECTHTSTVHLTTCHLLEVSATRPKKTLNLHLAVWIGSQCRSIGGINLLEMYHWIFPSLWCHSGNMKSWIEYWISRQKAVYFCWITSHGELLIKF